MKLLFLLLALLIFFSLHDFSYASFGIDKIKNTLQGDTNSVSLSVQNIIEVILSYLYLLAVIIGIWGGFHIFTAAGDEEKAKKGKTIIIFSLIGIVIIFLAGPIVNFVIQNILEK